MAATGASTSKVGAGLVIFACITMIPAAVPGVIYIRFFCDETNESRLQALPIAHMFFIGFYVLFAVLMFWAGSISGGVMQLVNAALMYYFYTVVKRYVGVNSKA
jgi:hypothetical protein